MCLSCFQIIILALIELFLKYVTYGLPLEPVDDLIQQQERIIFAGIPLVSKNHSLNQDDIIMAPRQRSLYTTLPLESDSQTTEKEGKGKSATFTLEPAYPSSTNDMNYTYKKPKQMKLFDRLPVEPTNITSVTSDIGKSHKRRGIVVSLPENFSANATNISTSKPEDDLANLLKDLTNLTSMEDDIAGMPKPDRLFAVMPIDSTPFISDTPSENLNTVSNDTIHVSKNMNEALPLRPVNVTNVMEDIVKASKSRGIFDRMPRIPAQANPNIEDDITRLSKPRGIFAKIPQDIAPDDSNIGSLISEVPNAPDLGLGYSNQIAKLNNFPFSFDKPLSTNDDMFNLPLTTQPFDKYKLLVVTAPQEVLMSDPGGSPWVIYIVYPQDYTPGNLSLPTIYFVNKLPDINDRKLNEEPIFVIDPNRKVTGLKSNDIEKFIKFKSKLTSTLDYNKS